jgi:beta-N-acetylglucosaminidase
MNETVTYSEKQVAIMVTVFLITILMLGWFLIYAVYNITTLQDTVTELSEQIDIYEEELNTYREMLADEEENNAILSNENDNLKYDLYLLENEVSTLENLLGVVETELDEFRDEHTDCRRPIVYSSENVLIPSNVTAEELEKGLRYGLRGCGEYFVEAEKEYGVNAIFLASIAAHESGWGRSKLAINKNNLFGYKQAGGGGTFREFESLEECILYVARVLKTSYLTEGAKYYNGTSVTAVNVKYCSSKNWAPQVNLIAKKIMNKIAEGI